MKERAILFVVVLLIIMNFICPYASATGSLSGRGSKNSPYLIQSKEDLLLFQQQVNSGNDFSGKYILQTSDIDLDGVEWETIAPYDSGMLFNGIYNGGGHYIENLTVTLGGNNAFFGKLGGTVMNLGIESGEIVGDCVGSITSHASASTARIINCYNKASVSGIRAGGIADNFAGTIANCWSDCELQSNMSGGIVSYDANYIINCYTMNDFTIDQIYSEKKKTVAFRSADNEAFVKRLNSDLLRSASLSGVSFTELNLWTVRPDGEIGFSNQTVQLSPSILPELLKSYGMQVFAIGMLLLGIVCFALTTIHPSTEKSND